MASYEAEEEKVKTDKDYYFELFSEKTRNGKTFWKWKYFYKGQVIAVSGSNYLTTSINSSLQRLQKNLHKYTSGISSEKGKGWTWKVCANNGNILAKSVIGYHSPKSAIVDRDRFLDTAKKALWVKKLKGSRGIRIREVS